MFFCSYFFIVFVLVIIELKLLGGVHNRIYNSSFFFCNSTKNISNHPEIIMIVICDFQRIKNLLIARHRPHSIGVHIIVVLEEGLACSMSMCVDVMKYMEIIKNKKK